MMFQQKSTAQAIKYLLKELERARAEGLGGPVFLTGAGLSVSAGIPLWEGVKRDLYKDLFDIDAPESIERQLFRKFKNLEWLADNVLVEEEKNIAGDIVRYVRKERRLPPELMLSFYRRKYGLVELQNFLEKRYGEYRESLSYCSLNKLVELGFLRYYITLNQDGIFERCLHRSFPPARWLSLVSQQDFLSFLDQAEEEETELKYLENTRIVIANLHGLYYRPDTLQIDPSLLVRPLPRENPAYRFLKVVLGRTRLLVVIGYRGADADIRGALEGILTNKEKLTIIWVGPKSSPNMLGSKTFNKIEKFSVRATADEFLSILVGEITGTVGKRSWSFAAPVASGGSSSTQLVCSAPGSLIIAGDYGVYINGKMIQIRIPLRAYAARLPSKHGGDKASYLDPYLGTWEKDSRGLDYIKKARKMLKSISEGNIESEIKLVKNKQRRPIFRRGIGGLIKDMLSQLRLKLNKDFNTEFDNTCIHTNAQFPTGSGAGDTLPYVIIGAMVLPESGEVRLEGIDDQKKEVLVSLARIWTWLYTYPNASHLRILPTFWNKKRAIFLLNRRNEQLTAFKKLDMDETRKSLNLNSVAFMKANLLLDTYSVLDKGKGLELPRGLLNFAVAYHPRRIILARDILPKSDTRLGVFRIDYERDQILLNVMADYTEEILKTLVYKGEGYDETTKINRIGKIISACHFGLVALGRGSRLVNSLVGALNGLRGIYGAKTSGGGPGGALLIAYNPQDVDFAELQTVVEQYQHKIICPKVLS